MANTTKRNTTKKNTIANRIAARFGDDGQRWVNDNGEDLVSVLVKESRSWEGEVGYRLYIFSDGSAILRAVSGWDVMARSGRGGIWKSVDLHGNIVQGGWSFGDKDDDA